MSRVDTNTASAKAGCPYTSALSSSVSFPHCVCFDGMTVYQINQQVWDSYFLGAIHIVSIGTVKVSQESFCLVLLGLLHQLKTMVIYYVRVTRYTIFTDIYRIGASPCQIFSQLPLSMLFSSKATLL